MICFFAPPVNFVDTHLPTYHLSHQAVYGRQAGEVNQAVLMAVDDLQATAPTGGGYHIGKGVESPIGTPIALFGKPLIAPPRNSSYCSGASYAAMIGALDLLGRARSSELTYDRYEAIRMQETNGRCREDMVKLWGWWNADGPGSLYALAMFTRMGQRVDPIDAEPGDFCNINWKSGMGHSVVFLGWDWSPEGKPAMRFWSSQKNTNGLGDRTSNLSSMSGVVFTRLTNPEDLFEFDPTKKMPRSSVRYDSVNAVSEQLKQSAGR